MAENENEPAIEPSPRLRAAQEAVDECFWGDYDLTAEEIVRRLDSDDAPFRRFLFGRIADNATWPSRLLRMLFSRDELETLLAATRRQPRWSDLRHRLIRANLTGEHSLVPERAWRV